MSETATPSGGQKKAAKPAGGAGRKVKKPSEHPKYSEMIRAAVEALKERGGSSRQAILKYIGTHYNVGADEKVINQHLKMSLRAGVKSGSLKQAKGTGASGSFRLGETGKKKAGAAATAAAKKKKKPASEKARSPAKKKVAAAAKKAKAAKSVKKAKTASKPKKAAAVNKPKKAAAANKPKKAAANKPKKAAAKAKKPAATKAKKVAAKK